MTGRYNQFLIKQAIKTNPGINGRCEHCTYWDDKKSAACNNVLADGKIYITGLCKQWAVYTQPFTKCTMFHFKGAKRCEKK